MPLGFMLPFTKATGSLGFFEMTRNQLDAVRSNILSVLTTNWGERAYNYYFGCNLIEFTFEPATKELKLRISDRIKNQVARWLPYVSLDSIDVFLPGDDPSVSDNGIGIRVFFHLNFDPTLNGTITHVLTP